MENRNPENIPMPDIKIVSVKVMVLKGIHFLADQIRHDPSPGWTQEELDYLKGPDAGNA